MTISTYYSFAILLFAIVAISQQMPHEANGEVNADDTKLLKTLYELLRYRAQKSELPMYDSNQELVSLKL